MEMSRPRGHSSPDRFAWQLKDLRPVMPSEKGLGCMASISPFQSLVLNTNLAKSPLSDHFLKRPQRHDAIR